MLWKIYEKEEEYCTNTYNTFFQRHHEEILFTNYVFLNDLYIVLKLKWLQKTLIVSDMEKDF